MTTYRINIPTTGWTRETIGTSGRLAHPFIAIRQEINNTQRLRVALQELRNGDIAVVDAVIERLTADPTAPGAKASWIEASYVSPDQITLVPCELLRSLLAARRTPHQRRALADELRQIADDQQRLAEAEERSGHRGSGPQGHQQGADCGAPVLVCTPCSALRT